MPEQRPGPIARGLVVAVNFYRRWISPLLPPSCRFAPSCSAYAVEALLVHGALRGTWLAVRRLLRCGPWHPGGWDPVPPRRLDRQRDSGHTVLHRDRANQTPAEE
ncbi:MAG TPA: membrane protein insertion efficiency factor YidD [Pseudonocardiaceae bacterium]|nr:membrane protein insertion efficiency factor YidD [Pseudonocardiaceae bacterium]